MDKKKYIKFLSLSALILMSGIIFLAIMSCAALLFGNKKMDVTSLQRYGLDSVSQKIAQNIKQPINITVYASNDLDTEYPELDLHRQNVMRMLDKFQSLSNGKITVNLKNPEPYTPAEYEAKSINIRPFPDSENTRNMYFGAVFSSGEGKRFIIPYFSLQRQNYAEYDISRILAKLNGEQKKNIGVISFAGNISDWQIFKKLEEDYKVVFLNNKMPIIPQNINTLMVYNPQQVEANFVYALDQFIMRGGNLILFIDPYAENVAQKYPYTKKNLITLLPHLKQWGLTMDTQNVVADKTLSGISYQTAISEENNPTYLKLTAKEMNMPSAMGEKWLSLLFRSAGSLEVTPQKETSYIPLFSTSEQAGLINADVVKYSNLEAINNAVPNEHKKFNLAYWIEGSFPSLFEKSIVEGTKLDKEFPPYLPSSLKPSKILVIADSDFIADDSWNLTGYKKEACVYDQIPANNNADFILSAIDYMSGNNTLSKIRINYLINDDKNIAEQIYAQAFASFADEYKTKEQEVEQLKKDLSSFQQKLHTRETGMSLMKIQELDEYNRRQQKIIEDLKSLNYKIQQKSGDTVNKIILANTIFIPVVLLILAYLGVKIFIRNRKQKYIRIINE